jgi:uncharacterized membrane protein
MFSTHHIRAFTLLCLFGGILAVVHVYLTKSTIYLGLVWNLILAVIPYVFAGFAVTLWGKWHWFFWAFWLLFFPNSLYIFTDFIHLGKYPDLIHLEIIVVSTMAIAGMIAGFASLELIQSYWARHYHAKKAWLLVSVSMFLWVFGVFIGRFQRFNSWDIVHDPLSIIREIGSLLLHPNTRTIPEEAARWAEQAIYGANMLNPYIFLLLYFIFFMLLYVFVYHTKRTK